MTYLHKEKNITMPKKKYLKIIIPQIIITATILTHNLNATTNSPSTTKPKTEKTTKPKAKSQKIHFKADKQILDMKTWMTVLTGNVKIETDDFILKTDKLTITKKGEKGEWEEAIADGKVTIFQKNTTQQAKAGKAVYDFVKQTVTLTEKPELTNPQTEDKITGIKMVYNIKNENFVVSKPQGNIKTKSSGLKGFNKNKTTTKKVDNQ